MSDELDDVRKEEEGRGRKRPVKAVALERQRRLRWLASLLADPKCTYERYLEVIATFQLPYDSDEYHGLVGAWEKLRGKRR